MHSLLPSFFNRSGPCLQLLHVFLLLHIPTLLVQSLEDVLDHYKVLLIFLSAKICLYLIYQTLEPHQSLYCRVGHYQSEIIELEVYTSFDIFHYNLDSQLVVLFLLDLLIHAHIICN